MGREELPPGSKGRWNANDHTQSQRKALNGARVKIEKRKTFECVGFGLRRLVVEDDANK